MDLVKEEQNNIYYITVRQLERATWNNEIGLVSYFVLFFGIFHVPGWLVSSASDLVEGRAWTAHTASVSRECFQYSSLSVFGPCFSSEFVRVRVFSDCCFSCLSLGTCDAHIFISSHDRSSTLCSTYTHVHRSTTWCLVGLIVPFGSGAVGLLATGSYLVGVDDVILWTRHRCAFLW